jgi:hypothetical protein
MFGKLLEPVVARSTPCKIAGERVTGMKEERIVRHLRPVLRQHRIVIDEDVIKEDLKDPLVHQGLYQLTHMSAMRGALKHDDKVDVLSNAMGYWAEFLNADAKKAEDERRRKEEARFEALLFSNTVGTSIGRQPSGWDAKRGRGRPSQATRGRIKVG